MRRITLATLAAVSLTGVGAALAGAELTLLAQRDRAERRASLLAVSTAARMERLDLRRRVQLAQEISRTLACTVTLLAPDGRALAFAPEAPPAVLDAVTRRRGSHGAVALVDEGLAVAFEALSQGDGGAATLVVATALPSPAARRGAVALLLGKLLVALALMGSLAVVVSLIVARDITNDLKAILRKAQRMAEGSAEALEPLPVQARDEVASLVTAFNRLQRRFADEVSLHREALARLDENERRRETLITTLRHELRTPLNSILGFAELLLQEVDGPLTVAQRDDVQMIARSGAALLRMVDDVLDLSAMASGRFEIRREPMDLAALAREVVAEAQGTARTRSVTLTVAAPEAAEVYGDPVALRRALVNLVVNAIEHAGGEVHVTAEALERGVAVAVRDNGRGIPPSELKRLFKPFERGRNAEARGAGLGLAITLGLVELHGGSLSAQSEVGAGSVFTATVPRGLAPLPGASEKALREVLEVNP
jgi:signal transduction histidine kinase